jgi:hypothetical protein
VESTSGLAGEAGPLQVATQHPNRANDCS